MVHIGGHEGLESADLIGHMIRTPDGGMAWKDGKLSEAFRYASLSLKTVLFVDEILRIRRREMSVLVSALAPGADGLLRLGTGRPLAVENGLAQEEVLTCDPANLWVVATTNAGAGYEVDDMEEALSDRFPIIVSMEGSAIELRAKLGPTIASKGFSTAVLDKMVKFWETATRLRSQGELNRIVNLRHLSEVIDMADSDRDLLPLMQDRIPQWADRDTDGALIAGQVKTINTLLTTTFS
ncbi:AAA family ATPase [Nevskia ramosa]|uniref:AAA family ATPase n=1 Tax=Nevskia ramosa TaxID=64002 RepID=UPI002352E63E